MTVLVPAKNAAAWIIRALVSVASQTDPNWEVQVLVDRSSSDATHAKAVEFKRNSDRHRRIHVNVSREPGLPHVYKELIDRAEPDDGICGFLDADDWLDPEAVSAVHAAYRRQPELGCVWTQFWIEPNSSRGWSKPLPKGLGLRDAFRANWWGAQHFRTFRKSAYLSSDYELQLDVPYAADYNLALVLAATDCPVEFIDRKLYHYVRSPGSISVANRKKQKADYNKLSRRFRRWCEQPQPKKAKVS